MVAAEIAKIHTIEWTPQLLYNEPLYRGMNANWNGLLGDGLPEVADALQQIVAKGFGDSDEGKDATQWYSVFASGPGIFGLGQSASSDPNSKNDIWSLANPEHVNGGVNHFGSPFNFPEEFMTVTGCTRWCRTSSTTASWNNDPNQIRNKIPVIETFRGKATEAMRSRGLANWALSMGRQRLGAAGAAKPSAIPAESQACRACRSATQQIDIAGARPDPRPRARRPALQ